MAFEWTPQRESAAELFAADDLSWPEIAEKLGVSSKTLARWHRTPEFKARIHEIIVAFQAESLQFAIADKMKRVEVLNKVWEDLQKVKDERAISPEMRTVAGGKTGLLVRTIKSVRDGEESRVVEEYAVDRSLIRSIVEVEEQAARQLGQWQDKQDVTLSSPEDSALNLAIAAGAKRLTPAQIQEQIDQILAEEKAAAGKNDSGSSEKAAGPAGDAVPPAR